MAELAWVMRLSSWRLARSAGRNGDSRARPTGHPPRTRDGRSHSRWMQQAGSGSGAQVLGQHLSGCLPPECLSRSTVQRRRDSSELLGAMTGEVGASREVLARQPIGVLVRGALPRAARIAEVDLQTAVEPELHVLGHLNALVPGQRPPKLFGKGPDRFSDRVPNGAGAGTRDRRAGLRSWAVVTSDRRKMQQHREPARALDQSPLRMRRRVGTR